MSLLTWVVPVLVLEAAEFCVPKVELLLRRSSVFAIPDPFLSFSVAGLPGRAAAGAVFRRAAVARHRVGGGTGIRFRSLPPRSRPCGASRTGRSRRGATPPCGIRFPRGATRAPGDCRASARRGGRRVREPRPEPRLLDRKTSLRRAGHRLQARGGFRGPGSMLWAAPEG